MNSLDPNGYLGFVIYLVLRMHQFQKYRLLMYFDKRLEKIDITYVILFPRKSTTRLESWYNKPCKYVIQA